MKKMSSAQVVATAALAGNLNEDVMKRMIMFIVDKTTDNNIIASLLNGITVDVKIKDEKKLTELLSNHTGETITKIKSLKVNIEYQDVTIDFNCKRFAQTTNETKLYYTKKAQDSVYNCEVEVENSWSIYVNDFDFQDSVEFEVV